MRKVLIVLAIIIGFSFHSQANGINSSEDEAPTVKIESGIVKGVTEGEVSSFKGIPYAAPPVDEYRWRPPQPVKPWDGVHDATEFGATCAQVGCGTAPGAIAEGSSEDCLYLNLWVPAGAEPDNKLPVMVWIHGGLSWEVAVTLPETSLPNRTSFL